jgi:hypothetical protein
MNTNSNGGSSFHSNYHLYVSDGFKANKKPYINSFDQQQTSAHSKISLNNVINVMMENRRSKNNPLWISGNS